MTLERFRLSDSVKRQHLSRNLTISFVIAWLFALGGPGVWWYSSFFVTYSEIASSYPVNLTVLLALWGAIYLSVAVGSTAYFVPVNRRMRVLLGWLVGPFIVAIFLLASVVAPAGLVIAWMVLLRCARQRDVDGTQSRVVRSRSERPGVGELRL